MYTSLRTLRCSGYSYVDSPGTPDPLVKVNSTVNLKSNRVNLIAQASPIEYLLYLPNVWAIQYKLGPERLTRLGNSNELRLPLAELSSSNKIFLLHYTDTLKQK